jgi:hypothetical protein
MATVIPYLSHTYPWFMPCLQDIVLTVPPYPLVFKLEDPSTVLFEVCWVVSPQLFFLRHMRPTDARLPTAHRTYGEDNIQVALVFKFYSTFEQQDLPDSQAGPMVRRESRDWDVQKY